MELELWFGYSKCHFLAIFPFLEKRVYIKCQKESKRWPQIKNERKQTHSKIQYHIGIHVTRFYFGHFCSDGPIQRALMDKPTWPCLIWETFSLFVQILHAALTTQQEVVVRMTEVEPNTSGKAAGNFTKTKEQIFLVGTVTSTKKQS